MTLCRTNVKDTRPKAVWGPKRGWFIKLALASLLVTPSLASGASGASWVSGEGQTLQQHGQAHDYKLDDVVSQRAGGNPGLTSRVIVTLAAGAELPPEFRKYARGAKLDVLNGHVLEVPNGVLSQLAKHPNVFRVHDDRPVYAHNYVTSSTVGAVAARQKYGYTGAGVGVAVIDSGISTWHDDLTINTFQSQSGITALPHPYGNQRVAKFVDLVNGQTQPYDDNGHGTHVAGVIAGNGFDSSGQKAGMAPDASIISLKVLNANGAGTVSNVIAALGWIAANASAYNIRVVNLSVGAPIRESYLTDPLTLAAKAVTDLGIVVVAAAGNLGRNSSGQSQWGGITAPGNAPWVLTVGASSTMGTTTRGDDTLGGFSSRGPSSIDFLAKPDLVAPGTGTVSLAVPGSTLYINKPSMLV
jgi:serine protease AprX